MTRRNGKSAGSPASGYVIRGRASPEHDVYVPGTVTELAAQMATYRDLGLQRTREYRVWHHDMEARQWWITEGRMAA